MHEYLIGFTARSALKRGDQYRNFRIPTDKKFKNYDHLVLVADKMQREMALELEERLDSRIKTSDKRLKLYQKYGNRECSYRSSYGGVKGKPNDFIHAVYIAWRSTTK